MYSSKCGRFECYFPWLSITIKFYAYPGLENERLSMFLWPIWIIGYSTHLITQTIQPNKVFITSYTNTPFAAKPSNDLLFIKLRAVTSRMPEMEKAFQKHQNGQVWCHCQKRMRFYDGLNSIKTKKFVWKKLLESKTLLSNNNFHRCTGTLNFPKIQNDV